VVSNTGLPIALYNAEWALTTQLEVIARQFDEMEDVYLRERKADLEQIAERVLRAMKGQDVGRGGAKHPGAGSRRNKTCCSDDTVDVPLVLIAHDLSPADMLQFKHSVFAGFITDVGGKTSHTAIVARSMDIPAVVGARTCSQLVRQDDWVIIDGDAGVVIVDPSPIILAEYGFKQRQGALERGRLQRLLHTPSVTMDGQQGATCWPTSKCRKTPNTALKAGAVGVGSVSQRVLVYGSTGAVARRRGAVPSLQTRCRGHAGIACDHPHSRRGC